MGGGTERGAPTAISWSCRAGSKSSSRKVSVKPTTALPVASRSRASRAAISSRFRFFSCFSSSCFRAFSYGRTDRQMDAVPGGDGTDTRQMDAALPAPFSFTPSPFSSSPESAPASPSAAHPVVAPRWGCSGDTSSPWGGGGVRVSAPNPQTVHPSQILPPPHLLGVRLLEAEIVATFKILLLRQEKLTLIRGIGQPEWGCPGWGDTVGGG